MAEGPPKDVLEKFEVGTAAVTTYQTSGVAPQDGRLAPSLGQADNYTVVTSPGTFDEAKMNRLMDGLSDAGNTHTAGDFNKGSTGALVAVSQATPPKPGGGASFDVVVGSRGDSQIFLATVDAQNNVTLTDYNSRMKPPENPMGSLGFGAEGERGGNELQTEHINVKAGEKVFVIAATDGAVDPHMAAGATANPGQRGYVTSMQNDIQAYLKANPDAPDLSRFLAERATKMGAEDNTTIASVRLGADTDLKGHSVTMAVFDGTGHEDGALSSALAKSVVKEIPGGQTPAPVSHTELDHVSTRTADLARVADPGTVDPNITPAKPEPAPVKKDPPKNGGSEGGSGTPVAQTNPEPHPRPTPGEEQPHVTKPEPPEKPVAGPLKSKFVSPHINHPAVKNARTVTGHGVAIAQIGVNIAQGKYGDALQQAATQVALTPATYKAAANLTKESATVAKSLGFVAKKLPLMGALVTVGFVAYEVGSDIYGRQYGKAAAAATAGTAEALGNIVGFGAGDAAREGVREVVVHTAGEQYAPDKSGIRTLVEQGVEVGSKLLNENKGNTVARNNSRGAKPPTVG